jgi:hypothetical protein
LGKSGKRTFRRLQKNDFHGNHGPTNCRNGCKDWGGLSWYGWGWGHARNRRRVKKRKKREATGRKKGTRTGSAEIRNWATREDTREE